MSTFFVVCVCDYIRITIARKGETVVFTWGGMSAQNMYLKS